MTNAKKRLAIASVIATLSAGALGAGTVFAAQHGSGQQYGMSGLVQAISQKFHLAPNDVQAVIDQQRQQMMDQMNKKFTDRLATSLIQAVKDGKLTQAQVDAITAKQAELKTFEASLQGKNPTDRQAAMKTKMDSLTQWAKDNGIPEQYVLIGRGVMGRQGMGMQNHDPKAMLDQAVKDGKLTQAQEDQIIAKQAEVKTFMDSLKGKSAADRQAAMKKEQDSLKQWAASNDIPSQYILPFKGGMMGGPGNGHGMSGGMPHWGRR